MTQEEYLEAITLIVGAARAVSVVDVPWILANFEKAEVICPLADPTLYPEKHKAMMKDKSVFEAALPLYVLGKRIEEAQAAKIRNILEG